MLGVAHSACNLAVTVGSFLPVLFHNLSRYDAHHIVKYLVLEENEILSAISRTEETFISFSVQVPVKTYINKCGVEKIVRNEIRFLDSFNFMASGLDSLAQTLQDGDLKLLRSHFAQYSDADFKRIRSKGIFPYSYLDCFEKFKHGLPVYGEEWKNTLTGKIDITEEMHQKAVEMYQLFKCDNFGDYHDAYLETDVFLLADVFELFRSVCINVYRLAYFYSAPNLSWDAMLITTDVELGLLSDVDMLLFCEKTIRGGLNGVGALRHFRANNKDLNGYNKDQKSVYGAFLDVTSLYGGVMMKKLPKDGYQWAEFADIDSLIETYKNKDSVGYFVEVDLNYPASIHNDHSDFPLAPEKLFISDDWLSPYSKQLAQNRASVPKLVETLFDKKNYICHIENLLFYLEQGLKVVALHRVLQFNQSDWLRPYIEKNTSMRKIASTTFEKNFYKLMSNACFGKTMENKRNRKNIQFVSDQVKASKLTSKPNFKSFQIISDNLCSLYFSVPTVKWDKPTPVGAAILDLSKLALYNFHYNEMRPRYGSRICVTYKDTDSLLYRIETDDLYKDMDEFKHLLDLSDYPTSHPLFDPTNKKVPLTMTDKLNGSVLEESVILRSKMYSIKFVSGVKQSAKGVQKVLKKTLHHDKYLQCLQTGVSSRAPMTRIHSANHQIQVTTTNKTALSCFDDKRFILDNGIDTLPYGHYSLGQEPPKPCTTSTDFSSDTNDDDRASLSADEEKNLIEFKELTPHDADSVSTASTSSFGC